ncbi:MAG: G1 family glutamic endopeptidase [Chloroflexota bacterium]
MSGDGIARCTVSPQQTAFYRPYFPGLGTYGQVVRGVVTQNPGWAGYVAAGGPFSLVTGTFTVPTIRPSTTRSDVATWVGIGGVAGNDQLIQAGAWETYDPATGQTPDVYAWWEVWPALPAQRVAVPVSEGDTLTVSIWREASGRWMIVIVNDTQGLVTGAEADYQGAAWSAEWIVEAAIDLTTGAQLPLAGFTPVSFSGIGFTGSETSTFPLWTYDLMTGAKRTVPSAVSSDGRSFTVTDVGAGS